MVHNKSKKVFQVAYNFRFSSTLQRTFRPTSNILNQLGSEYASAAADQRPCVFIPIPNASSRAAPVSLALLTPPLARSVSLPVLTAASKSLHGDSCQSFKYQKITPFTTCRAIISVKNYPGVFICDKPPFLNRERRCVAGSFRSTPNSSLIFMACFAQKQ